MLITTYIQMTRINNDSKNILQYPGEGEAYRLKEYMEEPDLQESFCELSMIFCNTSLQMRLTAVLSDSWEAGRWMMLEGRIAVSYCWHMVFGDEREMLAFVVGGCLTVEDFPFRHWPKLSAMMKHSLLSTIE